VAKLSAGGDVLGGVASRVSPFGGGSSGGIPFKIEGTTSNPIFLPDIGGMMGNVAKNPAGVVTSPASAAVGGVKGLFGKKKSNP
jgi:hypothetical protein